MCGRKTGAPKARKGKVAQLYSWNASEDLVALARAEALRGGENARIMLELEEGDDVEAPVDSVRRRLARTLVQLGMKIDPLVGEETNDA